MAVLHIYTRFYVWNTPPHSPFAEIFFLSYSPPLFLVIIAKTTLALMWAIIRKFVKNQKKGRFETNKKGFDKIRMESFFPTCMAKLSHGMNSKG